MQSAFKLQSAALLMALAAAYPLHSHASAGVVQFTAGEVTVRRGTAAPDPLTKGNTVDSGDAIETGTSGQAQIRFSDGGLVAIQPSSRFNVRSYADRNDPKSDSFLVDLLSGGMRAITGLIGKRNRENYKVFTSTATVGIRGSAFHMGYAPDGSLSVTTEQDEIEVCTRVGCIGLTAGESARVIHNGVLPTRTNLRATLPLPALRQSPLVAANQTNSKGQSALIAVPGNTGSGTTAPGTTLPGTTLPGTTLPGTTLPGTTLPGTTLPGTALPGTALPGTALPGTALPGTALPGTALPGTALPGTALPGTALPGTALPGITVPQQPLPQAVSPFSGTVTDLRAALVDGNYVYGDFSTLGRNYTGASTSAIFDNNQLIHYSETDYLGPLYGEKTGTQSGSSGALGQVTDPDFIGWGYWVQGQSVDYLRMLKLDDVHYIVGRPTPSTQMPNAGTAEYALAGGTVPTSASGPGQLLGGSLSVDFGLGQVGVDLSTRFGAIPVNISIPKSPPSPLDPAVSIDRYGNGATFNSNGYGNVSIRGLFTGALASRAGLVYGIDTGGPLGRVTGAAAFKQTSSSGLAVNPASAVTTTAPLSLY